MMMTRSLLLAALMALLLNACGKKEEIPTPTTDAADAAANDARAAADKAAEAADHAVDATRDAAKDVAQGASDAMKK